jgi:hypothetical protein
MSTPCYSSCLHGCIEIALLKEVEYNYYLLQCSHRSERERYIYMTRVLHIYQFTAEKSEKNYCRL